MPDDIPEFLADRFFDRLRRFAPSSVLDVGCGGGRLLRQCGEAGIEAYGIEPEEDAVAPLIEAGLTASIARAEELPFADRSFDWVTMRHMVHHLQDERPALAEGFRVCRSGVLVAEPWLDLSLASQRIAHRFDQWTEAQCIRAGHVHRMFRSAGEILAACPPDTLLDVEYHLVLRTRPEGWIRTEAAEFTPDLAPGGPEMRELRGIEAAAESDGLTYNGTAILALHHA